MPGCDRCDEIGGKKTFQNQVSMPIKGTVRYIDHCIHPIIAALNAANIFTVASCCGHGTGPGIVSLEDGRVLGVFRDQKEYEKAIRCGSRGNRTSSRSR